MRRGQRPSAHYRRVKTKRGIKRVIVNRHIPQKSVKIGKGTRRLFNHISNPKEYRNEFGGAIDYDKKGKIENLAIIPGTKPAEVYIPEDYEIQFHTHPTRQPSPPSPEDALALLKNKNQQAEMVIRNGRILVLTKTDKTKKLSRLPTRRLQRLLNKKFDAAKSVKADWEKDAMAAYKNIGFGVQLKQKSETPVKILIKPKE